MASEKIQQSVPTKKPMMGVDYSHKNLQKALFKNENLINTSFEGSDLRGADFSGADLTGANLTHVKTGITPANTVLLFFVALVVSMLSGYVAMLAGSTIHTMIKADDARLRASGIASAILMVVFNVYYYWKGGRTVIIHLVFPVVGVSILIGIIAYFSGLGTGRGMLFLVLYLLLVVVMVTIGTAGRAIAGVLSSSAMFILVGAAGSLFGKTVGGGVGTVIMAIVCALISKRALAGAKGFESLRKFASFVTRKWGTSFRNARLTQANFSSSTIRNADFTDADLSSVNWGDTEKQNCTPFHVKS